MDMKGKDGCYRVICNTQHVQYVSTKGATVRGMKKAKRVTDSDLLKVSLRVNWRQSAAIPLKVRQADM